MKRNQNERDTKILQYIMLALLFALAFLLPGYCVSRMQESRMLEEKSKHDTGRYVQGSGPNDAGKYGQEIGPSDAGKYGQEIGPSDTGQYVQGSGSNDAGKYGQESESNDTGQQVQKKEPAGTIVLDPGHGGRDPGVTGGSGIAERELNLVYAEKLAALLEQEGYRAVLTRTSQEGLYDPDQPNKKAQDMQRRCALIEAEQPLVTISIHQNSYPDASVCGPQVFYYEQSAEGKALAQSIQSEMNEQLEIARPRTEKGNASYYILKRSAGTTALVEVGFLSNPQEEQKLQEEAYQNQAAQAICAGILKYLEAQ